MATKNKLLPYVLFGIPLLIGGYFLLKSRKKNLESSTPQNPTDTSSNTQTISQTYTQNNSLPFKKGDKGGYVIAIQRVLGLKQDGKFGSDTDAKVRSYQKRVGLKVDGVVGAKTWNSLFRADFPNERKLSLSEIDATTNPNAPSYMTNLEPPTPTFVMNK